MVRESTCVLFAPDVKTLTWVNTVSDRPLKPLVIEGKMFGVSEGTAFLHAWLLYCWNAYSAMQAWLPPLPLHRKPLRSTALPLWANSKDLIPLSVPKKKILPPKQLEIFSGTQNKQTNKKC